ncbi:diacylglycerol O-acyltransferase/trehalose O-mycolyltransferase [Catenulispora sp. GP43]|uniref:alpha/beta hydrolase n=1 Tax=Catenulispora sp. GP43 TaxID=3156263 RepID=UPI00351860FB
MKSISVTPPSGQADDGSYIQSEDWLDRRMADIDISSTAVGGVVPTRIIVPARWTTDPGGETWPVLYLLHGGNDDYTSWTRETDIESFVSAKNVIVVMPDSSRTGLPTRWWNNGWNKPDYETFEAVELMQLLERNYHADSTRAVAGVSAGGYGAMILAAHFPRTFTAAASYSGIVNTTDPGTSMMMGLTQSWQGINPNQVWGNPNDSSAARVWIRNNPYAQAANLRGTSIFLSCGDDSVGGGGFTMERLGKLLEGAMLRPQNIAFANRLTMLGIPVLTDFYAGGSHDWSSWRDTFVASWPMLAASLRLPS